MTGALREHTAHALAVRSVPVADPGVALVDLLPDSDALVWSRRGDGLVGWGEAAVFRGAGPDRFTAARSWWADVTSRAVVRDEVGRPGSGLVAFASFGFSAGSDCVLVVPSVVVGRRAGHWWVTTVGVHGDLPPLPPELVASPPPPSPGDLDVRDGALSGAQWSAAVAGAVERIRAGALDKVVLARDLDVHAAEPVDLRWPVRRLAERYDSTFTFAVDGLVGATPELLVRLDGRLATSRVLAGTIRRTGSRARDEALAGSLARSSKDLEEHEYAVASVASALAPHCTGMNVPDAPFVLHLPNVMHLATDVTGVAAPSSSALELAAALHPTAAVCGTPREVAEALIDELEQMDRDRYAGPVGWVGANGDGEFGIALRSGRRDPADPRHLRLFAGCGVVADSVPASELAESNAKFLPMLDALGTD